MKFRAGIIHFVLLASVVGGLGVGLTFWLWPRAENTSRLQAKTETYLGTNYEMVKVSPEQADIRLFWKDGNGQPYGDFGTLKRDLDKQGLQLDFACNAGIFSEALRPGGLHMEKGKALMPLNLKKGKGNFHMKPNGVFYVGKGKAEIMVSDSFSISPPPEAEYATQSGPMLVIDGKLHPEFKAGSPNKNIRNGVGVDQEGKVWFVLSREEVNFYDFALLFRDQLKCDNALYLDGSISGFFSPQLEEFGDHGGFCGMIGVVSPKN